MIEVLVRSDDSSGVIGERARRNLKRLLSNIYWQGLGRWGIRLFPGSQDQYFRSLDSCYVSGDRSRRNDDGEPMEGKGPRNGHPGIPPAPKDFPRNVSLSLTVIEAKYLRERILTHVPQTLLAFLINEGALTEQIAFPWEHPQLAEFPVQIREQLKHARNFSEIIHGAALLYNLMLAEATGYENLIEQYRDWLQQWASALSVRRSELLNWDRLRFWTIVASGNQRISHLTRLFIESWLDLILSLVEAADVATDKRARHLIHERERQLKRGLARLDNTRARELWNGQAGTSQLDYRWAVAQTMIEDILIPLTDNDTHA